MYFSAYLFLNHDILYKYFYLQNKYKSQYEKMKHRYTAIADTPLLIRAKKSYFQSSDVSQKKENIAQRNIYIIRIRLCLTWLMFCSCATRRRSSGLRATTTQSKMLWTSSTTAESLTTSARSLFQTQIYLFSTSYYIAVKFSLCPLPSGQIQGEVH